MEESAFRIVAESMTNVARHSGAEHCSVEINQANGDLRVGVIDDGHGAHPPAPMGHGLDSMRRRAADVGGRLTVASIEPTGRASPPYCPWRRHMTVRVVLADDHPMYRYGLAAILEQAESVDVVASVGDGNELVRAAAQHRPDVVVTDLSMPDLDGVEATRLLLEAQPELAVLVLTMHEDDEHVFAALRGGCARLHRQGRRRGGDRPRGPRGGLGRCGVRRSRRPADRRLLRRNGTEESPGCGPSPT